MALAEFLLQAHRISSFSDGKAPQKLSETSIKIELCDQNARLG